MFSLSVALGLSLCKSREILSSCAVYDSLDQKDILGRGINRKFYPLLQSVSKSLVKERAQIWRTKREKYLYNATETLYPEVIS